MLAVLLAYSCQLPRDCCRGNSEGAIMKVGPCGFPMQKKLSVDKSFALHHSGLPAYFSHRPSKKIYLISRRTCSTSLVQGAPLHFVRLHALPAINQQLVKWCDIFKHKISLHYIQSPWFHMSALFSFPPFSAALPQAKWHGPLLSCEAPPGPQSTKHPTATACNPCCSLMVLQLSRVNICKQEAANRVISL